MMKVMKCYIGLLALSFCLIVLYWYPRSSTHKIRFADTSVVPRMIFQPINQCLLTKQIDLDYAIFYKSQHIREAKRINRDFYKYEIDFDQKENRFNTSCIKVIIHELDNDKPTGGGSNFLVELSNSKAFTLCSVTDMLNGIYIVTCPNLQGCQEITIYLMFANFAGYGVNMHPPFTTPLNSFKWRQVYCSKEIMPGVLTYPSTGRYVTPNCYFDGHGNVTWIRNHQSFTLASDGCLITKPQVPDLIKCLASKTMLFYGDGHVRNFQNYLFNNLLNINRTENVIFTSRFYNYTNEMHSDQLELDLEKLQPEKGVFLVFNLPQLISRKGNRISSFGEYLDANLDLIKMISDRYVSHMDRMKRMQPDIKVPIKIIWLSSFAYSDTLSEKHNDTRSWRNNVAIGTANSILAEELLPMGIEIFDLAFEASRIRNEETSCKYDYLCGQTREESVGAAIGNAFYRYLCQF